MVDFSKPARKWIQVTGDTNRCPLVQFIVRIVTCFLGHAYYCLWCPKSQKRACFVVDCAQCIAYEKEVIWRNKRGSIVDVRVSSSFPNQFVIKQWGQFRCGNIEVWVKSWGGICWGLLYQQCWIWRRPPVNLSKRQLTTQSLSGHDSIRRSGNGFCEGVARFKKTLGNFFRWIGLQITNGQAPVTLSAQACFCSDTSRLWPVKFCQS